MKASRRSDVGPSRGQYAVTLDILPGAAAARFDEAWFIHGMLEDEKTWRKLAEALPAKTSVLPEFPWSSRTGSYWGVEASGAEWIDLYAADRATAPDLVVCHSYGCNAMLEHLLRPGRRHPEFLVLVSPFYAGSRQDVSWRQLLHLIEGQDMLIRESISARDTSDRYSGWLLDNMVTKVRDRLGVYGWSEFLNIYLSSPDLALDQLKSRTLVVAGTSDRYSPADACERLAAAIPCAQYKALDGGHFVQETCGDALAEAILRFTG